MISILVVDDDHRFAELTKEVLRRGGFSVCTAYNRYDGLQLIQVQPPDALVLDDNMPHITTRSFCEQAQQLTDTQQLPILLYGIGMRMLDPQYVRHVGAHAALRKPAKPQRLMDTLHSLLNASVG